MSSLSLFSYVGDGKWSYILLSGKANQYCASLYFSKILLFSWDYTTSQGACSRRAYHIATIFFILFFYFKFTILRRIHEWVLILDLKYPSSNLKQRLQSHGKGVWYLGCRPFCKPFWRLHRFMRHSQTGTSTFSDVYAPSEQSSAGI
jgi:hypothetical protein